MYLIVCILGFLLLIPVCYELVFLPLDAQHSFDEASIDESS